MRFWCLEGSSLSCALPDVIKILPLYAQIFVPGIFPGKICKDNGIFIVALSVLIVLVRSHRGLEAGAYAAV